MSLEAAPHTYLRSTRVLASTERHLVPFQCRTVPRVPTAQTSSSIAPQSAHSVTPLSWPRGIHSGPRRLPSGVQRAPFHRLTSLHEGEASGPVSSRSKDTRVPPKAWPAGAGGFCPRTSARPSQVPDHGGG